jgi:hypothetical protein
MAIPCSCRAYRKGVTPDRKEVSPAQLPLAHLNGNRYPNRLLKEVDHDEEEF